MQKGIYGMKQYIGNAFTDKPFQGDPAVVCVMKHGLRRVPEPIILEKRTVMMSVTNAISMNLM